MDFGRVAAHTCQEVFGCPPLPYTDRLHLFMQKLQGKGATKSSGEARRQCGVPAAAALMALVRELQKIAVSLCPPSVGAVCVTPWTTLVHLCEVRQCCDRYGLGQLQAISASAGLSRVQTAAAQMVSELQEKSTSGLCHAVLVLKAAGARPLKRRPGSHKSAQGTPRERYKMVLDLARHGWSPKVHLHAIPEWRAMRDGMARILAATRQPRKLHAGMDMDLLRKAARARGLKVQYYKEGHRHSVTRARLLRDLMKAKPKISQKPLNQQEVRAACRKRGLPVQWRDARGHRHWKTVKQMRLALASGHKRKGGKQ